MKEFALLALIGFGMGVFFALGSFTWEWLAHRFLGWRTPRKDTTSITVEVDNKQAMKALDELQRKVAEVSAIIAAVGTKAAKRELQ